jgi:hypothetical protein
MRTRYGLSWSIVVALLLGAVRSWAGVSYDAGDVETIIEVHAHVTATGGALSAAGELRAALELANNRSARIVLFPGNYVQNGTFVVENRTKLLVLEAARPGTVVITSTGGDGMRFMNVHNLIVRNIGFNDCAGDGMVFTAAANVLHTGVQWNNNAGNGLDLGSSRNFTLKNCTANNNGRKGITGTSTTDYLIEDCTTNGNNKSKQGDSWKGGYGWDEGGIKFWKSHRGTFRRHTAKDNLTNGIWIDWDVRDITVESCLFDGNTACGLFVEAAQGPVLVKNSLFRMNARGLLNSDAANLTVDNCVFYNNQLQGQLGNAIEILAQSRPTPNEPSCVYAGGPTCPTLIDFESGKNYGKIYPENMIVKNSVLVGHVAGGRLFGRWWVSSFYESKFIPTYTGTGNIFYHYGLDQPFQLSGTLYADFGKWTETVKETGSKWTQVDTSAYTGWVPSRPIPAPVVIDITQLPQIRFLTPKQGDTVAGKFTVRVDASSSVSTIQEVRFFAINVPIGTDKDGSDGWSAEFDPAWVSAGSKTVLIKVQAFDKEGKSNSGHLEVDIGTPAATKMAAGPSLNRASRANIPSGALLLNRNSPISIGKVYGLDGSALRTGDGASNYGVRSPLKTAKGVYCRRGE